jgi:cytidylate kinase
VARELGWAHLDSGALYRALTLAALDNLGESASGWSAERVVALAEDLPVRLVLAGDEFRPEVAGVGVHDAIRSARVTAAVSALAALAEVRRWANARQREAAASHPRGVVVDGRDIGTVVFPDARLKIFLTATPEARAARRLLQRGEAASAEAVRREAAQLAARDQADATRPVAPLRVAPDAVRVDTTALSLGEQVARVVALARPEARG